MNNYQKQYYIDNKEEIGRKTKEWRINNPEKFKNLQHKHYQKNKRKIKETAKWHRDNNIPYRIKCLYYAWFKQAFKRQGVKMPINNTDYLGCSFEFFQKHIESLWLPDMNWKNHGRGKNKWQFDHKIALSIVDLSKNEDIIKCFNYLNVFPVWHSEHKTKSANERSNSYKKLRRENIQNRIYIEKLENECKKLNIDILKIKNDSIEESRLLTVHYEI